MEVEYSRQYRRLYEQHWWFRCRRHWILRQLEERLGDREVGRILDIGAGDGLFLPSLERFGRPEGLEPETEAVRPSTCERWPMHLRTFDESFDPGRNYGLITMLDVLEHLEDDVAALRHARSLLRPGGLLVLTVPALRILWTRHDDLNHHQTRYTRGELRRALETAGFRIADCLYLFHWLVPVKLLIRGAEFLRAGEPELPNLPPPWLNRSFYFLTRLEQETLTRLRPPFGSSIFAVATIDEGPAATERHVHGI